jgi:GTPase SAR1 family protein
LLYVRVKNPQAYVTVTGETSTGKSSLINGLFDRELLPVAGPPTTATVTHVICINNEDDRFFAINRDATQDEISRDQFVNLNKLPDKSILRLQVRATPKDLNHTGLQVFDTPGYNAIVTEHEELLRSFLPESDAIVFVAGYRTGFGQVDQDLLEVIRSSLDSDEDTPVFLVINRVPENKNSSSKRVIEIISNAYDCLKREPILVLIPSIQHSDDGPAHVLPDSTELWNIIIAEINKPKVRADVSLKLKLLFANLIEIALESVSRDELRMTSKESDAKEIEKQIEFLKQARKESLSAVEKMGERLKVQLPKTIDWFSEEIKKKIKEEINASNKWLGYEDCMAWITGHALQFEVRKAAKSIEEQIFAELEALDQEIEEIANTTIKNIQNYASVKSDAAMRFGRNISKILLRRVSGYALESILRGIGGVGGVAAGTGNIVKKVVSRAGKLVGKRFSKQVYNQIGKTFTKKAVQRLNVVINITIECLLYLKHVKKWQPELSKKISKSIDDWKLEIKGNLLEEQIPEIVKKNNEGVLSIYEDLIQEQKDFSIRETEDLDEKIQSCRALKKKLSDLQIKINNVDYN